MKPPAVNCGETSEATAAAMHGAVALLYFVMLWYHAKSTLTHWWRR
jgi:hypothetical protein